MADQWVPVFVTSNMPQMQFVLKLLNDGDIPAVIVNKQDSMHVHLNNNVGMEIHVRSEDVIKAKFIINKELQE